MRWDDPWLKSIFESWCNSEGKDATESVVKFEFLYNFCDRFREDVDDLNRQFVENSRKAEWECLPENLDKTIRQLNEEWEDMKKEKS